MNIRDKVLQLIGEGAAFKGEDRLFAALNLHPSERKAVKKILRALEKEGAILPYRGGWATPEQAGAVRGRLRANARGFGFVIPEDESIGHDFFIPKHALNGAYDKDLVLCMPVRGTEDEGAILRVLERGLKKVVGNFYRVHNIGRVTPDNPREPEICVPSSLFNGAKTGDKVVAVITSYPAGGKPFGKVCEIFGRDGNFETDELAIIRAHGLKEEFSAAAETEAASAAATPIDLTGRRDLRGLLTFTIDGADTRDMDDAVSLEVRDGKLLLGVHIADVAAYVKYRGRLDNEAYERGTSVYFPDRVLPMLPRSLSNGACSLNEGEDRATLSCFITYTTDGKRLGYDICESVICSRHKLTYPEVTAVLEGDKALREKYADIVDTLENMRTLCLNLEKARKAEGSVDLDVKEAKIYVDGDKITIPDYERTISERIIEQFMIAANGAVAEFLGGRKLPCLYRVHEKPSPEKCENFIAFLSDLGITANVDCENIKPRDFQKLLYKCADKPYSDVVNKVMLRSMQKARYSNINAGHFGLAMKDYCHFTSPIRRYPDLFVHRVLKAALSQDTTGAIEKYARTAEENGNHLSLCERTADEAERDVDKLYILEYMSDRLGEEYDAIISGVTAFGVFCELSNSVEGLVPIENLPTDGYEFIEEKYLLAGRRHSYRLGDPIKVRVAACDKGNRRVLFSVI